MDRFPTHFIWGAATAAIQVEGFPREDGGGISVWDAFCRRPGVICNDDVIDTACDHFHRFREDVKLMKQLGLHAYRFSISWPRIFPEGDGKPNPRGLDFYQRLIDELLAQGITPYVTLFHWETPQSLEERFGGWRSKRTAYALGEYAAYVAERISDRVGHFFTTNEIICFTRFGYGDGGKAPGLACDRRTVAQCVHNGVLGHALALAAVRAHARGPVAVGLAENPEPCMPVWETPEDIAAAQKAFRRANADRLTLILEGAYLPEYLEELGADAPEYDDAELRTIGQLPDFIGFNVYNGPYVRHADNASGYEVLPYQESYPRALVPWYPVSPDAPYWGIRHAMTLWPQIKGLYLTEIGCPALDVPNRDGEILDTERILLLRHYLRAAQRATREGYPLCGAFLWSLLDNFEWSDGYSRRFGLFYVNFSTLERTPKLSAEFYRRTIAANKVV